MTNQLPYLFDICEDVPVVVANVTILTNFVILEMPEDNNMSIILGRPFLNTARDVIDCNKSKITFHINGNEHMVHFPKKKPQVNSINSSGEIPTIVIGGFKFLFLMSKRNMIFLSLGTCISPLR